MLVPHTDLLDLSSQQWMGEQLEGIHDLHVPVGMVRGEGHAVVLVVAHGVAVVVLGHHEDAAIVRVHGVDQSVREIQFVQLGRGGHVAQLDGVATQPHQEAGVLAGTGVHPQDGVAAGLRQHHQHLIGLSNFGRRDGTVRQVHSSQGVGGVQQTTQIGVLLRHNPIQNGSLGEFVILERRLERLDVDPREEGGRRYAADLHLDGLVEGVHGGVHHRGEGGARFDRRAVIQRGDELLVLRVDRVQENLAEVGDRRLVQSVYPRSRIARHHEVQLHRFARKVHSHIAGAVLHGRDQITGVRQVARLLVGHVHRGGREKEPARVGHRHGGGEVHQDFVAVRGHLRIVEDGRHSSAFESRHLELIRALNLFQDRTARESGTMSWNPSQTVLVNVRMILTVLIVVPVTTPVLRAAEDARQRTVGKLARLIDDLAQSVSSSASVVALSEIQELVVDGQATVLAPCAVVFVVDEDLPFAHDVAVLRELQVLNIHATIGGGGGRAHQRDPRVSLLEPLGRGTGRVVGIGGREIAGHQIVHRLAVVRGARVRGQADVHETGVVALHDSSAPEVGEGAGVRVVVAEGVTRRVYAHAQLHTPGTLHPRVGNAFTQAQTEGGGGAGKVRIGVVRVLRAKLEGVFVSDVHTDGLIQSHMIVCGARGVEQELVFVV